MAVSNERYHSITEVVVDVAEVVALAGLDDVEGVAVKVAEIAEKVWNETADATETCMKNPNWDPDPGC